MLEVDRTFFLQEVQKLIEMNRQVDDLQRQIDQCQSGSYAQQQLTEEMDNLQASIDSFILGQQ